MKQWPYTKIRVVVIVCTFNVLWMSAVRAGDWPQWRCDIGHGASTPEELPQTLHLQWMRQLPKPRAAWPISQHKLQFDTSYEPVVMDKLIFVPSMVHDTVTAYDTETGQERWRVYTGGPVRFAPVAWEGKLYVVSDDGYLYCLDAKTGKRLWRFRGGPSEYMVLGNERLISLWPARGAPVLHDGSVYFAASIWPFMGTFIHALDATSGRVLWTNSGSASDFILQPHSSPAFAGVAPQGYMSVDGDSLLISSGRSVPAVYDRKTGEFLYFHANTKRGGHSVYVSNGLFFNDGLAYRVSDGSSVTSSAATVLDGHAMFSLDAKGSVRANTLTVSHREVTGRDGKKTRRSEFKTLWQRQCPVPLDKVYIKAGSRLYCGNRAGLIAAVDIPDDRSQTQAETLRADISWRMQIQGEPWTMLAADNKLFVVTLEGSLYCFGAEASARVHVPDAPKQPGNDRRWAKQARQILEASDVQAGYALVLGPGSGQLLEAIVRQSDLQVIGLEPDSDRVLALRRRFDDAGLYGRRVTILQGSIMDTPISPYLASLVVAEDLEAAGYVKDRGREFIRRVFHVLRPYGGAICLALATPQKQEVETWAEGLARSNVKKQGDLTVLRRFGALPDSAPWTHQYADVANTVCSQDKRAKAPLGLLWFGGPSHLDVLPRHGHGPSQQVMGGRLFVQGIKVLSARDVYTGRVMWRKELPQLNTFGMYYDESYKPDIYDRSYNQLHIPGANAWGANFVVAEDRLYLIAGHQCLVMDPATGDTLHEWTLEKKADIGVPNWGYIGVYEDLLIAATAPFHIAKEDKLWSLQFNHRYAMGSRYITVMDRYTGKVLWERKAIYTFRHNTIVAGHDTIFCIDGLSPAKMEFMARRGLTFESKPQILALDARTGQPRWSADETVFGTWLGYSEEFDVLLQAGARAGDRAPDEVSRGMAAYRGASGKPLWRIDDAYSGPPILYHDRIITQTGGSNTKARPAKTFQLLTGQSVMTEHPLTGDPVPWEWVRFKGCNTAIASEHLLTFRSASGAYVDLSCGMSTTSIGGFKSGCTSNLVVADGVLNAPDYTRTCTCSYQNQTSFAMVHFPPNDPWYPSVESWSFDYLPAPTAPTPVKRVGINFGAAGNRRGPNGTFWLEYPSVGGPSPDVPIRVSAEGAQCIRYHASRVDSATTAQQGAVTWVGASALAGVKTITIRPFVQPETADLNERGEVQAFAKNALNGTLDELYPEGAGRFETPVPYTVRLYFADIERMAPGQRVFDVRVQGQAVLTDFDMAAEAKGSDGCLIREFKHILIEDTLQVVLQDKPGSSAQTLINGIELIAE
jgi:outer membrane protein assembly factor BamB